MYPKEYFYPYCWNEKFTEECVKENTICIHRWDGSWIENPNLNYLKYKHFFPVIKEIKIYKKILISYLKRKIKFC